MFACDDLYEKGNELEARKERVGSLHLVPLYLVPTYLPVDFLSDPRGGWFVRRQLSLPR